MINREKVDKVVKNEKKEEDSPENKTKSFQNRNYAKNRFYLRKLIIKQITNDSKDNLTARG